MRLIVLFVLLGALVLGSGVCPTAFASPLDLRGDITPDLSFGNGRLMGKVTNAADGDPIERVEVCAEVPGVGYCTNTSKSGEYELNDLPASEYDIKFSAYQQNFVPQYYDDKDSRAQADPVSVVEGVATSGIDAALQPGGIVKGKTTRGISGEGMAEILVCATPVALPSELYEQCATSNASGEYEIERLESGEYTVEFWPSKGYLGQYYDDVSTVAQATPVDVVAGQGVSQIDAAMQVGGEIAGTVTSPGRGPLENIEVCAIALGEEPWQGQCTHTQAGGVYSIQELQSGEYRVAFHGTGDFLGQYYKGRATLAESETVKVTAGSTTSGVDASMQEGGRIAGRVTSAGTGEPLEGIEVCAHSVKAERTCAGTDAAGEYTIEGLAAESYTVAFDPWSQNYFSQYYGGAEYESEATKLTVVADTTLTGIDAALEPGGEMTGVVRSENGGAPIEGARVCARNDSPFAGIEECVSSGPGGRYTLTKLRDGAYSVQFSAAGFVSQSYGEMGTAGESEPVIVISGLPTPEIDAALDSGAGIAGKVTSAATDEPLDEIEVCATPASREADACARTGPSGEYTIMGLAEGEYTVSFSGAGYPLQYYGETFTRDGAKPVAVSSGRTTDSIDGALQGGGSISGLISSALTSAPLQGITACVRPIRGPSACAESGTSGQYTLSGLPPGSYTVEFEAAKGYLEASYPHEVTVSQETIVSGIDVALQSGGRITGQVREAASGESLAGVEVCAYLEDDLFGTCATTNVAGLYTIESLASGDWAVGFSGGGNDLARQFFQGAPSLEDATMVSVGAGQTTEDVNAVMIAGGQISGTVTNASGGTVEGAEVCASPISEEPYESRCAKTDSQGLYTIAGLADGQYLVTFRDFGKDYETQYSEGVYWAISATPVSVTIGVNSEGVDAQLHTGGKMMGTVDDAATGQPLPGIEVCAREIPPEGELYFAFSACELTRAAGAYALSGLAPGEYEVSFSSPNRLFASQVKDESVVAEGTNEGVGATMVPGGTISGEVIDEAGGRLDGAQVCATATVSGHNLDACAKTNAKGDYRIAALEAASYEVHFEVYEQNYAAQYYEDASRAAEALPVTVPAGGGVTGIDAKLKSGGEITGRLTSAVGGESFEFGSVCAVGEVEGETRPSWCARTEADGEYTIVGLPSGSYKVRFSGGDGDAPQYYGGAYLVSEATAVVVSAGSVRSGIDAALSPGGKIRGKVTASVGAKDLSGVTVCADLVGGEHGEGGCGRSSADGDYTINGLDPGSYIVEFTDKGKYQTQYYQGVAAASEATAVTVALGASSEGIDAEMLATNVKSPVGGPKGGSTTGGGASQPDSRPSGVGGDQVSTEPSPKLVGAIKVRLGVLSVPLRCTAASGKCLPVTVTVSIVEAIAGGHVVAVSAGHHAHRRQIDRTLVIGSATAMLSAGRSEYVLVRINATGRRLIRRWGSLTVLVEVRMQSQVLSKRLVRLRSAKTHRARDGLAPSGPQLPTIL